MARRTPTNFRLQTLSAAVAACFIGSFPAYALPGGASVASGSATFVQNGTVLSVTNSNNAIINWQNFSIGKGETTRFIQPSELSSVLNRVVSNNPSELLGSLLSNGRVFLVNPNGILVGPGANINVASFVASTLPISDADFLARRLNFTSNAAAGKLSNQGNITTPDGGSVYLIAPELENSGLIRSPHGEVILAAGQTVQIGDTATPGIRASVTGDGKTTNLGQIVSEAGSIGLVGALVKNSGTLNAGSAVQEGGRIYLRATQKLEQTASGIADASGSKGGTVSAQSDDISLVDGKISATGKEQAGGKVEVLGEHVAVIGNAEIDASGASAGGTILVGGDNQGSNPDIQNARRTYVGTDTLLKADALTAGDGGKVIVWADDITRAYGRIRSRGAGAAGNGGFIETSGKKFLDVAGININAAGSGKGTAGTWLLDPDDLTVVHENGTTLNNNLNAGSSAGSYWVDTVSGGSTITDFTLDSVIGGNASVRLNATNDLVFDGSSAYGPVVITKNTSDTFATELALNAGNQIRFVGDTTFQTSGTGASTGALSVLLNPANGLTVVEPGATLSLIGSSAPVSLTPGNGAARTFKNFGTFNLIDNAYVSLSSFNAVTSTTYYSSFINAEPDAALGYYAWGTVNVQTNGASVAAQFPFQSGATDAGRVENHGSWHADLTKASQSYEVQFINDDTGATLYVENGGGSNYLSLQNASYISKEVNIGSGSTLWLSEYHGISPDGVLFNGATVSGDGILKLGGGAWTVNALLQNTNLQCGVKFWIDSNGYANFSNSTLADSALYWSHTTPFTVPSGLTFSGNTGIYSVNDINLSSLSIPGNLYLAAGWNGSDFSETPGVGRSGSIVISNGTVSVGGDLWAKAGDQIRLDGASGDTILSNSGSSQTLSASGIQVIGGNGRASIQYVGSGTQYIDASNISLTASTSADNSPAEIASNGHQSITADNITLIAMSGSGTPGNHGSYALIKANGAQEIIATNLSMTAGKGGADGYSNFAGIVQDSTSGYQKITINNGGTLSLQGGEGYGQGATSSNCTFTCYVSSNYAEISNDGSGGQLIDFVSGGTLSVSGGANGSLNYASISNNSLGEQKIWSSGGTRPSIYVNGGNSGGYYSVAEGRNLSNEGSISSDGTQTIYATSLTLDGKGGGAGSQSGNPPVPNTTYGGAMITAPEQYIDVSGNLNMTGGNSSVTQGQFGISAPAVIGYDHGANIVLRVGGTLTTTGSAASSPSFIGAAVNDAAVDIEAASFIFGNHTFIGDLDGVAGPGSQVKLTAVTGGIQRNTTSDIFRISTHTLTASAQDSIDFSYGNRVDNVDISSTNGNIVLKTNNPDTLISRLDSYAATGNVSATNSGGSLTLMEVVAGQSVSLTAKSAIVDGNGEGVTNITAPNVSLSSQMGGISGSSAISADLLSPSSVSVNVAGTYGGVKLASSGGAPDSLSISDTSYNGGQISYIHDGWLTTNSNFSLSTDTGDILLKTQGTGNSLLLSGGQFNLPAGHTLSFYSADELKILGDMGNIASAVDLQASGRLLVGGSGKLRSVDAISGSASVVDFSGTFESSNGKITLTSVGDLSIHSSGQINATAGNVELNAGGNMLVEGSVTANQTAKLTSGSNISVVAGTVSGSNQLSIASTGQLAVSGGYLSGGDISITADNLVVENSSWLAALNNISITTSGDALLRNTVYAMANKDVSISANNLALQDSAFIYSAEKNVNITTKGNIALQNGAAIIAGDDVHLTLTGSNSKLILNDTVTVPSTVSADVYTGIPATVYIDFPQLASGGIVIDGVDTAINAASGSGFFAADAPAIPGSGIRINYGLAPATDTNSVSNTVVNSLSPSTTTALASTQSPNLPQSTSSSSGESEFGNGTTTGDNNEGGKRKRGGMCRI